MDRLFLRKYQNLWKNTFHKISCSSFAVVGPSWQRLIYEISGNIILLCPFTEPVSAGLPRRTQDEAPGRMESLKKFRLWEFEIMQRAPDGLAWWSLACAVPSFHSPMPCRGRSLSLSRPTTHWGQSLLVGGHSQWGHSQATLRPGHWAGRRRTRATLCKVLCPDTPSVTQYYGSCCSRLRPPPETSTLRPIFWVKSSQVGTFPIHPYTHPPGNHQVPRSRLFKPFQTNWKKPSLKRLTFEATIEDPSIQVIFQTFQNTITGNPFAFDNVSYPVQWRVFILIVIICHSDDDPIETNWVWISRFQRPVESQGWAAGRDDATSSMI